MNFIRFSWNHNCFVTLLKTFKLLSIVSVANKHVINLLLMVSLTSSKYLPVQVRVVDFQNLNIHAHGLGITQRGQLWKLGQKPARGRSESQDSPI